MLHRRPCRATSDELYNYGFANFAGFPNTHDAGLVILDQPITMSEYGQLPTAGVLDSLATARGLKKPVFTASGYGLTYSVQEHSALSNISYRSRLMAQSTLVNLSSANTDGYNLQTQGNGDGRGGTCSGDSGGPVFLGGPDSNLIVGVTSFGMNSLCRGTDYRLPHRHQGRARLDQRRLPGQLALRSREPRLGPPPVATKPGRRGRDDCEERPAAREGSGPPH